MGKRYVVRLSNAEREWASRLVAQPSTPARVRVWASVLLAANDQQCDQQIATTLGISVATVQRVRYRYALHGFDAVMGHGPATPVPYVLSPDDWNVRLLAIGHLIHSFASLIGLAVVDYQHGKCLGQLTIQEWDCDTIVAENVALVQAKLATTDWLHTVDRLDEIVITQQSQFHFIRFLDNDDGLMIVTVVDRFRSNLGLVRQQLNEIMHHFAK